jgi:branched-subunit amino acid ABC-type transport system permease component
MDHLIDVLIAVVTGVAVLTLISLGLAVIFGMMRVINFAQLQTPSCLWLASSRRGFAPSI